MPSETVISIFQLGDFHYSKLKTLRIGVDAKDVRAPGGVGATLGLPLDSAIEHALVEAIAAVKYPVIAVCGDLTTHGDKRDYRLAVQFLRRIVRNPRIAGALPTDRIHVVPGNHDIAFKTTAHRFKSFDSVTRFGYLTKIFAEEGLAGVLAVSSRSRDYSHGKAKMKMIGVNTARGAGASRRFMSKVTDDPLLHALQGEVSAARLKEIYAGLDVLDADGKGGLAEVLDVPILHPADLTTISTEVQRADRQTAAVVLAHHGLLPQHTPRLNPYTEMANGGQARRDFLKLNRPLIYLHGHIHADVVETVRVPDDSAAGDAMLICIAAPELREGFNKIDIEFDAEGNPLGGVVTRYRIKDGEQTVVAVPEQAKFALASRLPTANDDYRDLLKRVVQKRFLNGRELVAFADDHLGGRLVAAQIEGYMESLVWHGVLEPRGSSSAPFVDRGYMFP